MSSKHVLTDLLPLLELDDDAAMLDALYANFDTAYERLYNYTVPSEAIEIVTFRVEAYGIVEKPVFKEELPSEPNPKAALLAPREVYMPETGDFLNTPVYDRELLKFKNQISGPAVIEQMDSTTLVLPGQTATVDTYHNLIIEEGDP